MTSNVLAKSTSTKRAAGAVSAARRGAAAAQPGGGLDVVDATALLGDIGYLLVHGAPSDRGPAYLLVAIRPQPTRAHFDPEHIEYWSAGPATAEPVALEWPISAPATDYSWGSIKIVDRIGAANAFVSFGGTLSVFRDGGLSATLFSSEAPILAMAGRGEGGDPLASSDQPVAAAGRHTAENARIKSAASIAMPSASAGASPMSISTAEAAVEAMSSAGHAAWGTPIPTVANAVRP